MDSSGQASLAVREAGEATKGADCRGAGSHQGKGKEDARLSDKVSRPPSATRLQQLWYSSYAVLLGQEPSRKITFQWAGRHGPSGGPAHSFPYHGQQARSPLTPQRNVSRPFKIIFIHTGREKAGLAAEQKHPCL